MGALRIESDGDVLRITLARPESRNAFDAALIAELSEAFVDVGTCRAVVLAGDGPSFCAGADVDWMRASADLDLDANVADANALRRMLEAIDGCPAPVVAVVQGHALGGGVGLVACSDIVARRPASGVRVLGGEARDRPGRHLAVRAPEDRRERRAALLRDRRALRRDDRAADRARPRGGRRSRRGARRVSSASSAPPGRAPRATPSASCSSVPTAPRPPAASPSGVRARRARKGSAPSSIGGGPRGRRLEATPRREAPQRVSDTSTISP